MNTDTYCRKTVGKREEDSHLQAKEKDLEPSLGVSGETNPADPLILDFWPPAYEKINVCCVSPHFVVLCYSRAKQKQK